MFNLYHTERMVRDGIYRREKEDLLRVEHAKKKRLKSVRSVRVFSTKVQESVLILIAFYMMIVMMIVKLNRSSPVVHLWHYEWRDDKEVL